jgi:membrane protease YdiL (CAAX protease family)
VGAEPIALRPAAPPPVLAAIAIAAIVLALGFAALLAPLGPLGLLAAQALGFGLPALALAARDGAGPGLGLVRPSTTALVGAALAGAGAWVLIAIVLGPALELLPDRAATEARLEELNDPAFGLAARLALYAAMPAVLEELLCRGILCRHLAPRLGAPAAIAIAAVYFAALHGSLTQGIPALATGLICGALCLRSGSVVPAIAYHFVNNASILLLSAPELGLRDRLEEDGAVVLGVALALAGAGFALVRRSRAASTQLR